MVQQCNGFSWREGLFSSTHIHTHTYVYTHTHVHHTQTDTHTHTCKLTTHTVTHLQCNAHILTTPLWPSFVQTNPEKYSEQKWPKMVNPAKKLSPSESGLNFSPPSGVFLFRWDRFRIQIPDSRFRGVLQNTHTHYTHTLHTLHTHTLHTLHTHTHYKHYTHTHTDTHRHTHLTFTTKSWYMDYGMILKLRSTACPSCMCTTCVCCMSLPHTPALTVYVPGATSTSTPSLRPTRGFTQHLLLLTTWSAFAWNRLWCELSWCVMVCAPWDLCTRLQCLDVVAIVCRSVSNASPTDMCSAGTLSLNVGGVLLFGEMVGQVNNDEVLLRRDAFSKVLRICRPDLQRVHVVHSQWCRPQLIMFLLLLLLPLLMLLLLVVVSLLSLMIVVAFILVSVTTYFMP